MNKSCEQCSSAFDLGVHKPIDYCCRILCYTCVFNSSPSEANCPKCNSPLPKLSSLQASTRIIEYLQHSSLPQKQLKKSDPKSSSKCLKCKKSSSFLKLPKINEGFCEPCSNTLQISKSPIEEFKCVKSHKLYFSLDSHIAKHVCSMCNKSSSISSHCFKCDIHLCHGCTDMFLSIISCLNLVKCRCQGEIFWQPFRSLNKCSTCKTTCKKLGRFFCAICSANYCVFCVSDFFNDINCFVCSNFFHKSNIPSKNRNNELVCKGCSEDDMVSFGLIMIYSRKCRGNHDLIPDSSSNEKCDLCGHGGELFKCIVCGEEVCGKCRTWIFNSIGVEFGRCLKGHFTRKTMLPDRNTSIDQVRCRNCHDNLADVSIFCNICNVDQCENCFGFIRKVVKDKIEIGCRNCSNEMKYIYYSKLGKCSFCVTSFDKSECFFCSKCKSKACYKCAKELLDRKCASCMNTKHLKILACGHFFCEICYESINSSPLAQCPIDQKAIKSEIFASTGETVFCEKHSFVESNKKARCKICTKEKEKLWSCSICEFVACKSCKIWHMESLPTPENITCSKNHSLRLTPNAERFYDKGGKYKCDACSENAKGKSLHCLNCKLDYCTNCYLNLKLLIVFFTYFQCACKGNIFWKPEKAGKSCSCCKTKYKKSGFFECQKCNLLSCIKCCMKGRKEVCDLCNKSFTKLKQIPNMTSEGIIVCENCKKILNHSQEGQ